jgi:ribosomal protein L11 methyltransferase
MRDNPFAQEEHVTQLRILTDKPSVAMIEDAFDDALAITAFEQKNEQDWYVDILIAEDGALNLPTRLALLQAAGAVVDSYEQQPLEMRDWVAEIQAEFPPLKEGRFYIHGSHVPPRQRPVISLQVNAGNAFGTGEHETTRGCLHLLDRMAALRNPPSRVFDLGCGTAILAMAAQKLWPSSRVVASDIDAVSVHVARENAKENGCHAIDFYTAAGFRHPSLINAPPFELIIANILANPLIMLAGDMCRHLAPGGVLILSGLLNRQEKAVLNAYHARGLQLQQTYRNNGWSALKLVKAA